MQQKFDAESSYLINLAAREAERLGHNYIDTEHLLLALSAGSRNSSAYQFLQNRLGDVNRIKTAVELIIGRPEPASSTDEAPELTPRGRKVYEIARDTYVNAEGLRPVDVCFLYGLIEGEGLAADVLNILGITYEELEMRYRREDKKNAEQNLFRKLFHR